jgi:hypothetical protein
VGTEGGKGISYTTMHHVQNMTDLQNMACCGLLAWLHMAGELYGLQKLQSFSNCEYVHNESHGVCLHVQCRLLAQLGLQQLGADMASCKQRDCCGLSIASGICPVILAGCALWRSAGR